MELGVYSFGNTPRKTDGSYGLTSQAIRDLLEAVRLADEVGLDFFGFGEHHTASMPVSSPTALVNAAATQTRQIRLGTAVSVLSSDDPIRVFQQLSTADAIAPGRIEMVAGRGSSTITFPLFDLEDSDYDNLFSSKLDLLLEINRSSNVNWSGSHRQRPLKDRLIVPRPEQPLRIWLGSGGSPESVNRAIQLGMPLFLGVLGGDPAHWAHYSAFYREGWKRMGRPMDKAKIALAVHGFVGDDNASAKALYQKHEQAMFLTGSAEIGRPMSMAPNREHDMSKQGMVFAGSAEDVAERIISLHGAMGHDRQILQMDVGGMPHQSFLKSIELLGTKVLPLVKAEIG